MRDDCNKGCECVLVCDNSWDKNVAIPEAIEEMGFFERLYRKHIKKESIFEGQ